MTNNKNTNNLNETTGDNLTPKPQDDENRGFEPSNQGQNLGGGKSERTIDVAGGTNDGDEFSKTDQSITQAAPGQTATNTTQGGSNI